LYLEVHVLPFMFVWFAMPYLIRGAVQQLHFLEPKAHHTSSNSSTLLLSF
jgi:hypothetical protein